MRTFFFAIVVCYSCYVFDSTGRCCDDELGVDEVSDLIARVESPDRDLFVGLGVKAKRRVVKGPRVEEFDVSFDQLTRSTWRVDQDNGEIKICHVRNGDMGFKATAKKGDDSYSFSRIGYGPMIVGKQEKAWYSIFAFLDEPYLLMGYPLKDWLLRETFIVKDLFRHSQDGFEIEGIEFERAVGGRKSFGTITWLPNHNYVFKSIDFKEKQTDGTVLQLTNLRIEYKTVSGRTLPYLIVSKPSENVERRIEAVEFIEANDDRRYYTPESIGLESPKRDTPGWIIWLGIAIVCGVLGLVFRNKLTS